MGTVSELNFDLLSYEGDLYQEKLSPAYEKIVGLLNSSVDVGFNTTVRRGTDLTGLFPTGSIYIGTYLNGLPHGKGRLIFANGDQYIGDFKAGKIEGRGFFKDTRGLSVEGEFADGKAEGKCVVELPSGDIYVGDLSQNRFHGQGTLIFNNGDIYEGDFVNGSRTGYGKYLWPEGDIYEGNFVEGFRTGYGKYSWSDGSFYEGDFEKGWRSGRGFYHWSDGSSYEGDFVQGMREGQGTYIWKNGDRFVGEFHEGSLEKGWITVSGVVQHVDYSFSKKQDMNLLYIQQILGLTGNISLNCSYSLSRVISFLEGYNPNLEEIRLLVGALEFLSTDRNEIGKSLWDLFSVGKTILLPLVSPVHILGCKVERFEKEAIFTFYNSGYGLGKYHEYDQDLKKFQTALKVSVPVCVVTQDLLERFLNAEAEEVLGGYEFILGLEGAQKVIAERGDVPFQAPQKNANCTLEWIFAYLKNSMGEKAYHELRISLFETCLKDIEEIKRENLDQKESPFFTNLERLLLEKIAKRRVKLENL